MSDVRQNPFVIIPGTVQQGQTRARAYSEGDLTWSAFDTWLAEDEVLHTHPRSPYVRIDALPSSRHVREVLGGKVVAESYRPTVLTETGLVPRYYLPWAGLVCFWPEKSADLEIYVDGERVGQP